MFVLGAALVALTLAASGCANAVKDKLLVAEGTGSSAAGVKLWAVSPGDDLEDGNVVIEAAAGPNSIATRNDDGTTWVNGLGRVWKNTALLSYTGAETSVLSTTDPGGSPHDLAESASVQSTVIRRGVYVRTADGCELATSATESTSVGKGSCAISSDERWVVSWPSTAGDSDTSLSIRDLRGDHTRTVKGLGTVVNAVVLSKDARVFAVVQTADGDQGVVLDATDGSEIGRTKVFPYLDVTTLGAEATGFVILSSTGGSDSTLSYVDTDAKVTEIESGYYLAPVGNGAEITYLSFGEDVTKSSVKEWSPGDDEPETLLSGQVGAGTADGRLVILREVSSAENSSGGTAKGATVEFWRPGAGHELTKVLTIPAPSNALGITEGGTGASVSKAWVKGSTAYLQVDQDSTSSFVRIDLTGDHSDAPVLNAAGLLLESLDVDGTALLTVADSASGEEAVQVVGPHDDEPTTRATFTQTGVNLIHEGTIYVTAIGGTSEAPEISVRSVRATGDKDPELLWKDSQIAGATWPEQNGATVTSITTVGSLLAAQQAATQSQQSGGGATTGAAAGTGATAGAGATAG